MTASSDALYNHMIRACRQHLTGPPFPQNGWGVAVIDHLNLHRQSLHNVNHIGRKAPAMSQASALKGAILTALFAAAAAAAGYLLMAIPNVELFLLTLFAAGRTLGVTRGISAALAASLLYFGLNPQGGLFPPLLISQMIGAIASPLAGALWGRLSPNLWWRRLSAAILGALTTLWYDIVTNLAYPLTAGFDMTQTGLTLVAGIPFAIIHIGSNTLIFFLLALPLQTLIDRRNLSV